MAIKNERSDGTLKSGPGLIIEHIESAHFEDEQMADRTGISKLRFGAADLTPHAIETVFKNQYRELRTRILEQRVSELEASDRIAA